ncbi:hypothetical protein Poli38472_005189 [Pythium oligandrum]|uniref:SPRY domain-containing protein n=1 Tax=Pythium oligandrum TaxID=41045 RepID=A0A8K1CFL3_PYTOL|nr:hypothetical protein Poli38472_005189 [Pythium oligandrum]|eukprot:TMW62571.1 hypothetical protein Poli38472_005189 [Pythium oligandrum]
MTRCKVGTPRSKRVAFETHHRNAGVDDEAMDSPMNSPVSVSELVRPRRVSLWKRLQQRALVKVNAGPRKSCESLFEGFFPIVTAFLDIVSLLSCEQVCRAWHEAVQDGYVWEQFYCIAWRQQHPLPPSLRGLPIKLKHTCMQRATSSFDMSTRAKTWTKCNGVLVMHNTSLYRDVALFAIESARGEHALAPLGLALTVGMSLVYYEARVRGSGSIGLVSISSSSERLVYGYGSEHHVGWFPVSYGFHGDNGRIYWNDGSAPSGGYELEYGPTWGENSPWRQNRSTSVVVGCGYDMQSQQLFFTKDGEFLGMARLNVLPTRVYAAAVSLHQLGDSAEINTGRAPFVFDIEGFIARTLASRHEATTAA